MKTIALVILIHLQIIDVKTKETLPAVSVKTDKSIYYSDLDGNVTIPNNEKIINIGQVSYEDINNLVLSKDTILELKSL